MYSLNKLQIILILYLNISMIITEDDPDLKLCEDETIDAAVSADDGKDYIFIGDYFWQLNTYTGVVDAFALPIDERWPHLPTPIDSGFLLDLGPKVGKFTVFIRGNEWYKYKGQTRVDSGKTTKWTKFPTDRIQTAFTFIVNSTAYGMPTFFIYKDDDFARYNITDINSPTFVSKGKVWTLGRFIYFINGNKTTHYTTIRDWGITVRGILANRNHMILFGEGVYCTAEINTYFPLCEKFNSTDYFKCPRNAKFGRIKGTTDNQQNMDKSVTTFSPTVEAATAVGGSDAFKINPYISLIILFAFVI